MENINNEIEEQKVKYVISDQEESSDGEQEDMIGTLYFLDNKSKNSLKLHNESIDPTKIENRNRGNSAEGTTLLPGNPFLQQSVIPKQLEISHFTEKQWRVVYTLIYHKALIMKTLAKVLRI